MKPLNSNGRNTSNHQRGRPYTNAYFESLASQRWTLPIAFRRQITPWPRSLRQAILTTGPRGVVVDVGCGSGGLLELLESIRPDLTLVGTDLTAPRRFRSSASRVVGDAMALPLADASVDGLIFNHVLEHIPSATPAIIEARRVLKENGWVYVETPNERSARTHTGPNFWDDPSHVRPYSTLALKALLSSEGFKTEAAGRKRSILAILFGLPLGLIGLCLGKRGMLDSFWVYASGLFSYVLGRKMVDPPGLPEARSPRG